MNINFLYPIKDENITSLDFNFFLFNSSIWRGVPYSFKIAALYVEANLIYLKAWGFLQNNKGLEGVNKLAMHKLRFRLWNTLAIFKQT